MLLKLAYMQRRLNSETQNTKIKALILIVLVLSALIPQVYGDWPMWRADAGHSASVKDSLPLKLKSAWRINLPKPLPAWPASQKKLNFDRSYTLIASENTLFVTSMISDGVSAYDLKTGKQKWNFISEGPVRFAPVYYNNKIYCGSDDGFLYCLNAETGKLLWKIQGAPSGSKIIGNGCMISTWPVRGAPVISGGNLYFAAGIWPFMGIFIHCIDAETGEKIWTNSGSGSIYIKQQHYSPAFAGIAPQGYLAVSKGKLFISGGRTVPAVYDAESGKMLYYKLSDRQLGKNAGGYRVAVSGDYFFNNTGVYKTEDGKPLYRSRSFGVYDDGIIYNACSGKLYLSKFKPKQRSATNRKGKKTLRLSADDILSYKTDIPIDKIHLKSGNKVYFSSKKGHIGAIDVSGKHKLVWWKKLNGEIFNMIASNGHLAVVTDTGELAVFNEVGGNHEITEPALSFRSDPKYLNLIKSFGINTETKGYCLVLGADNFQLIKTLLSGSKLDLVIIDNDADKADELRRKIKKSIYASRVYVFQEDPGSGKLAKYFASFIIAPNLDKFNFKSSDGAVSAFLSLLRPYNGKLIFNKNASMCKLISDSAQKSELYNLQTAEKSAFVTITHIGPLKRAGTWTHQYCDAANSVNSTDQLVKMPLGMLWFGGPSNDKILPRHGHGPSPQVVGGRFFIEGRNILRAVDVYTGRLLWEKHIKDLGRYYDNTRHHPGANKIGSNYVSMNNFVYVMKPEKLMVLDPATGHELKTIYPPEGKKFGFVTGNDKYIVMAVDPVVISKRESTAEVEQKNHKYIIQTDSEWKYALAGDFDENWTKNSFDKSSWKKGKSGFGYGDKDDQTVLNSITSVFIRKTFSVPENAELEKLFLSVDYDDAFIAYLNGHEICRSNISGSGKSAKVKKGHEAGKAELFDISRFSKLLKPGKNIIALEGHNVSKSSSDFSLIPALFYTEKDNNKIHASSQNKMLSLEDLKKLLKKVDYAPASRKIIVYNSRNAKKLWEKEAVSEFRHNTIILGDNKLFVIDGFSKSKQSELKKNSFKGNFTSIISAFNLNNGEIVWTENKDVTGTWLSYHKGRKLLIEAGSYSRDRAKDESRSGLAVYKAESGKLLWRNPDLHYNGPVILNKDKIITQGWAYSIENGKRVTFITPETEKEENWRFKRNYGCNTAVGSDNFLFFRSAAAGYYDLEGYGGTGNFGGFKSGCTSNLIAADGVVCAPDYTKTCTCSYQNQSSVALVHSPEKDIETWTFTAIPRKGRWKNLGINFGAPGDHKENDFTCFEYPVVGGPSPKLPVKIHPGATPFRKHSMILKGNHGKWIAASGLEKVEQITLSNLKKGKYTVTLYFSEPNEKAKPGNRVFDLIINGEKYFNSLDIAKEAGINTVLIKKQQNIVSAGTIKIELIPKKGKTIICGIELKKINTKLKTLN